MGDVVEALADPLTGQEPLAAGLSHGVLRSDPQGRYHALLIERPEAGSKLSAILLSQTQPGGPFSLTWRSNDDPLWSFQAFDSTVVFEETDEGSMPDVVIRGPLPVDSPLRERDEVPSVFIEQSPFARQRLEARWRPVLESETDSTAPAILAGYQLQSATVEPSPLTTLASMLEFLQAGDVTRAQAYTTRIDILDEAARLGMIAPGDWMAVYINELDREIQDESTSLRIRFFDNADRNRSYEAQLEQDSLTGEIKVAELSQIVLASSAGLVTPAPPRPTSTPTATPTPRTEEVTESLGVSGEFTLTVPLTETFGGPEATILNPTLEPTPTSTPTFTPTPTDTPTATLTPSATPTSTDTPTQTPTPTETPSPTPTEKPLPIPSISPETVAPLTGYLLLSDTGRLRGGPSTEYIVIASMQNGTLVDIFGITETGEWLLVRVAQVDDGRAGVLGWVSSQLVVPYGDYVGVPLYRADGLPIDTPAEEPVSLAALPTATPTPTPLVTPVVVQPTVQSIPASSVPAPEAGELSATIGGAMVPADPLKPLEATLADGRSVALRVENAVIEVWGGVFDDAPAGWVPASGSLLWPSSQVYLQGEPDVDDPNVILASRVRIIGAPPLERVQTLEQLDIAEAVAGNSAIALLGSRGVPGVFLLDASGTAQQIWQYENRARWVSGDPDAGFLLREPDVPGGISSFSWVRNDGNGLQIFAQPYYTIQGIAGDAYGGLWWIEAPRAALDQWQLWHYAPASAQIALRVQASASLFAGASDDDVTPRTPILLAVEPQTAGDPTNVTLFVDTADRTRQEPYTGLYRLSVQTDETGRGEITDGPIVLLQGGLYLGPLVVSPDLTRLAYFVHNPEQPSLTAGALRPANTVNVLTLSGRGASIFRTVYTTETRFEFLAPDLAWQGNDRLLLARSRFAPGTSNELDRFGAVQVQLPPPGAAPGEAISTSSFLLPDKQTLMDFAACLDEAALVLTRNQAGEQTLGRWEGQNQIFPLFSLPTELDRTYLCWRARP